ncbi:MAG: chain length determinant protein tyrosine kinase EpsG [Proteobacteria bacterium]|nr:chain length determinant protein tyrosine kinase EpsG [Pseudomonadota bacterium]HQR03420.1 chain length determinant protein tyrosine kinase EpsG [Rhodocyclaceae bacterium]
MKGVLNSSNVVSTVSSTNVVVQGERSIGTLLIQSGRLTLDGAEAILQLQREKGLRFGDAAVELGLLTPADIEFALSRQFDHSYLVPGESPVSQAVISAYSPMSPQARAIGALRSQLMLRWFDGAPSSRALAVVSAERGEGRSYIAANLAVAFSQMGQKTLLIDADLRHPIQHLLFGITNRHGLSAVLTGRGGNDPVIQPIDGLPHLSVLPAGVIPPNPLELLARPLFPQLLRELSQEFDAILIDSPSSGDYPDAQTIAVRAGAALVVARKNTTRMWKVRGISESVNHASATIVGAVFNVF